MRRRPPNEVPKNEAPKQQGDGNEAWGFPHQELERKPDGTINNCARANLQDEKSCQVCKGKCPEPNGPPAEQVRLARGTVTIREPGTMLEAPRSVGDPRDHIDLSPGDELSYTRGKELYTPVKFNAVEIGPFAAKVTVRPGETGSQAGQRAKRAVDALWNAEYEARVPEHIKRAEAGRR